MELSAMSRQALSALHDGLLSEYNNFKARGIRLDLSRGKPCTEQLALGNEMLRSEPLPEYYQTENGFDCRNYGLGDGIPEMKRLFSDLFGIPEKNILVGNAANQNECDFFFPAIVETDQVTLGLCSHGQNHSAVRNLAASLRDFLS